MRTALHVNTSKIILTNYTIEYVLQLSDRISTEKSRAVDRYTFQF